MFKIKRVIQMAGLGMAASWGINAAMAQATYTIDAGGLESFDVSIDGTSYNDALAGGIALNYVSGVGSSFTSVCTDISATLYLGYNYTFGAPAPFTASTGLAPTWGAGNSTGLVNTPNEMAAINAAANLFYQFGSVLSVNNNTQSALDAKAGLQLAVWAALYNTTAGVNSVSLDGSRFDAALPSDGTTWSGSWGQTFVGTQQALNDASADLAAVNFAAQYSGDILIPAPTTQYGLTPQEVLINVTPVPEPTTMIAGALLLLPFAASTVRLRRNRAA
jgi:hypothetical protein